jgi:shikimate dehydrogenase
MLCQQSEPLARSGRNSFHNHKVEGSRMLERLNGETSLYPIIGDPIIFVKSPQRMTAEFQARNHNGICVPIQVPDGQLESVIRGLGSVANVRGLLITMPHKNTMFTLCATSSKTSRLLGVVSVVRRNADGSWHGDMLDGLAFVAAQRKNGAMPEGARVLQVGAGGAGSAIAVALLDAGVRELVLHDTNQSRVEELVRLLSGLGRGRVVAGPPDPAGCDIVVNATPLGMSPGDPLPVSAHLLTSAMFVGDVVAGHGVTPFLQAAHAAGCKTADGVQMVEAGIELIPDFLLCQ